MSVVPSRTALMGVLGTALLFGLACGAAQADVVYTVSDQFSYPSFPAVNIGGTFSVNPVTGLIDSADLIESGSHDLNNLTNLAVDSKSQGVDLLVYNDIGNNIQLDIVTGAAGSNINGLIPSTYAGGPIAETLDTFFYVAAYNDYFTPTGLGTVTGPELSPPPPPPPPPIPEPATLTLLGTAVLATFGCLRARKMRDRDGAFGVATGDRD